MINRIRKAMDEKDQGFTLIELLVVIIIIGILAAIAIPVFLNQRKKGVDASIKADLKNAATTAETVATQDPSGTSTSTTSYYTITGTAASNLVAAGYVDSPGNTLKIKGSPATGYCITATNSGATSTNPYYYDSQLSGYQGPLATSPTGGACANANTGPFVTLP